VPLQVSNKKLVKSGKMIDFSFANYNCAWLSAERLSWLMGSQDGSQLGLMKDLLVITECQNKEQFFADLWGRHCLLIAADGDPEMNESAERVRQSMPVSRRTRAEHDKPICRVQKVIGGVVS
jgi:hypothetical protein